MPPGQQVAQHLGVAMGRAIQEFREKVSMFSKAHLGLKPFAMTALPFRLTSSSYPEDSIPAQRNDDFVPGMCLPKVVKMAGTRGL